MTKTLPHPTAHPTAPRYVFSADGCRPVDPVPATKVHVRNTFVYTPKQGGATRFHLPASALAFWVDGKPDIYQVQAICGATFIRFATTMTAPDGFELCDECVLAEFRRPYVYRFFDAQDRLLYIGFTIDPAQRFKQHSRDEKMRRWWPYQHRHTLTAYDTMAEGQSAEKTAILTEKPLYNRKWVSRSEWLEPAA